MRGKSTRSAQPLLSKRRAFERRERRGRGRRVGRREHRPPDRRGDLLPRHARRHLHIAAPLDLVRHGDSPPHFPLRSGSRGARRSSDGGGSRTSGRLAIEQTFDGLNRRFELLVRVHACATLVLALLHVSKPHPTYGGALVWVLRDDVHQIGALLFREMRAGHPGWAGHRARSSVVGVLGRSHRAGSLVEEKYSTGR